MGPLEAADAEAFGTIDPASAEKAFVALRPRLLGLARDHLVPLNVDLKKAALAAVAVARWIGLPEIRARFQSLPPQELNHALLDDFEPVTLAAWHAARSLDAALSHGGEVHLPPSLLEEATGIKQRMFALAEYHFHDDALDGPEVSSIKLGAGRVDLASDLARLAALYDRRHALVRLDPKNYIASDVEDARRCANEIMALVSEGRDQEQKAWNDLTIRAWTLLVDVYAELSAAGAWLFRNDGAATRFPSLYVAGRGPWGASQPPPAPTSLT